MPIETQVSRALGWLLFGAAMSRSALSLGQPVSPAVASASSHRPAAESTTSPGKVVAYDHPEVGRYGGCTATLISGSYFLTAGHCAGTGRSPRPATKLDIFLTQSNVVSLPVAWTEHFYAGSDRTDVALGKLATPLDLEQANFVLRDLAGRPHIITPATLGDEFVPLFKTGTERTRYGFGCVPGKNHDGLKRAITTGQIDDRVCAGDSGGPTFLGDRDTPHTVLVGITSHEYSLGDVGLMRERIFSLMRADDDGFEKGIERAGFELSTSNQGSPEACRDACFLRRDCRSFSYRFDQQRCYLKRAESNPVPSAQAWSGIVPRTRPGKLGARPFDSVATANVDQCLSVCGRSTLCHGFDFSSGACRLFSQDAIDRATLHSSSTFTAGIVHSGVDQSTEQGRYDLETFACAEAADCQARCYTHPRCISWVHQAGSCWLKAGSGRLEERSGTSSGQRRGWEWNVNFPGQDLRRFVVKGDFVEYDTDYYGGDLPGGYSPNVSVRQCRANCIANLQCGTWVHHDYQCWLKSSQVVPSYVPGSISGMVPSTESASRPETCQTACMLEPGCKAWVLWTGSGRRVVPGPGRKCPENYLLDGTCKPQSVCFLKRAVPNRELGEPHDFGMVSGVAGGERF